MEDGLVKANVKVNNEIYFSSRDFQNMQWKIMQQEGKVLIFFAERIRH
jgi:hypothetical protein